MLIGEHDITFRKTGGSAYFLPLPAARDLAEEGCRIFIAPDKRCQAKMDKAAVKPDLALGDVVFYNLAVPHRTQEMILGKRLSYIAGYVDMDTLRDKAMDFPICHREPNSCVTQPRECDLFG